MKKSPLYVGLYRHMQTVAGISKLLDIAPTTLKHRLKRNKIKPTVTRIAGNLITHYYSTEKVKQIKALFTAEPLWSGVGRPKKRKK